VTEPVLFANEKNSELAFESDCQSCASGVLVIHTDKLQQMRLDERRAVFITPLSHQSVASLAVIPSRERHERGSATVRRLKASKVKIALCASS
jgi:hypothetical protein